ERDLDAVRPGHGYLAKRLRAGAKLRRVAHAHREALAPFYRHGEVGLADALINHLLNRADVDAIAGRRLPINLNVDVGRAGDLLRVNILGAGDGLENRSDFARALL